MTDPERLTPDEQTEAAGFRHWDENEDASDGVGGAVDAQLARSRALQAQRVCGGCKHMAERAPLKLETWKQGERIELRESGHHACSRMVMSNRVVWRPSDEVAAEDETPLSEPAVIVAENAYPDGEFLVLPTFGCNLWEGK